MPAFRTTMALVTSTALLGASAAPALAQDTTGTYPSDSPASTQTPKHKKGKRHGRLTDAQLTTVAQKLGVTLEALKAAQADVKAAVQATDARETRAEEDALLAQKLGVTVEQLRAAFASVRPADGGRGRHGDCGDKPSGSTTTTTTGSYPSDASAAA